MILNVVADGQSFPVEVPDSMLSEGQELFNKMDADMNKGWKWGREWVDNPNVEQRCQIVADRLLTALENDNKNMQMMMAAYILSKNPMCETVVVDVQGEVSETHFM